MTRKVLLAGESRVNAAMHSDGSDRSGSVTIPLGTESLLHALKDTPFALTHMPAHEAAERFPFTAEGLARYDAIILSDLRADTLLFPQSVWQRGKPMPNRLKLIRDWTRKGGGLMMIGGHLSFQGIDGRARWRRTPVEDVLPVTCHPYDDRIEVPEGFLPEILGAPDHPVLAGLGQDWPVLLGANEVVARGRADIEVLAQLPASEGGHPLLVAGHYGKGRSLAWASDIGPHWASDAFTAWDGFARLWINALSWLTGGG